MSLTTPSAYKVIIRHNIVVAIEAIPVSDESRIDHDPLQISSMLAANNLCNGCLDGEYLVADSEAARYFARLSLDFMKRTVDKSLELIDQGAIEGTGWRNPCLPENHR